MLFCLTATAGLLLSNDEQSSAFADKPRPVGTIHIPCSEDAKDAKHFDSHWAIDVTQCTVRLLHTTVCLLDAPSKQASKQPSNQATKQRATNKQSKPAVLLFALLLSVCASSA